MQNKIGFISLGCAKATYDSERLLTAIRAAGYEIIADYQAVDLVVINTCSFIDAAIEESLVAISEATNNCDKVIVTGCLGSKKTLISDKFPNLLTITPPNSDNEVLSKINQHLPIDNNKFTTLIPSTNPDDIGIKLTPKHYSWLKIAEGCNQQCSFCIIPSMRGKLSSRYMSEILQEAERLVKSGVKELLIVAQDTMAFGVDIKYRKELINGVMLNSDIINLAKQLSQLGVWIRFHYLYPYPKINKLVELMADGVILPYLDMPLQHASPRILQAMRRPANSENMLEKIKTWREICPDINLRTTIITGFPGETETDFEILHNFIELVKFNRLGVFTYSSVDGAKANLLANPVAEKVKKIRQEILLTNQQQISFDLLQARIGTTEIMMVDEIFQDGMIARTKYDAPEVDGVVHIHTKDRSFDLGDFIKVKITANDEHDLEGVLV